MIENDLSYKTIGAAIEIHKVVGFETWTFD